jgi:hypothetical protein
MKRRQSTLHLFADRISDEKHSFVVMKTREWRRPHDGESTSSEMMGVMGHDGAVSGKC